MVEPKIVFAANDDGGAATPPADPPADPPAAPAEELPADLGEGGKRALIAEREQRKAADAKAAKLESELEKFRQQSMTEQEKAIEKAKADGRNEAAQELGLRLAESEVRVVAANKLNDPQDAVNMLGELDRFLTKDGTVDNKAIASAIDALIAAKPYLAIPQNGPKPLPGGGATPSSGVSLNDEIRRIARH